MIQKRQKFFREIFHKLQLNYEWICCVLYCCIMVSLCICGLLLLHTNRKRCQRKIKNRATLGERGSFSGNMFICVTRFPGFLVTLNCKYVSPEHLQVASFSFFLKKTEIFWSCGPTSKLLEKFSCPVKKCPHQFFENKKFIAYFQKLEKSIKTWCGQLFQSGQGMLFSNLLDLKKLIFRNGADTKRRFPGWRNWKICWITTR